MVKDSFIISLMSNKSLDCSYILTMISYAPVGVEASGFIFKVPPLLVNQLIGFLIVYVML